MTSALASFVPRVVVERVATHGPEPWDATEECTALFIDVEGFTVLATGLAAHTVAGAEELARILNAYVGAIVDAVLDGGGDIRAFAGDALIATWPAGAVDDAVAAGHDARRRAAAVELGSTTLGARMGVGVGPIRTMIAGGHVGRWYDVHTGPCIRDAAAAADTAGRDEVGVSEAAAAARSGTEDGGAVPSGHRADVPRAADVEPDLLAGFVPTHVRAHLARADAAWLAELRTITCTFAVLPDIDEATSFDRIQAAVLRSQQISVEMGASLAVSVDDKGVALLFTLGVPPRAHEDDPRRGLRVAHALSSAMEEAGLRCHVGVASGRAYIGLMGNGRRRTPATLSEVVNLAARLMALGQGLGASNTAIAAADTIALAPDAVRTEALPPARLKGFDTPVVGHRIQALGTSTRSAPEAAVFGRREQRAVIETAVAGAEQSTPASSVLLIGDAGAGKSMLVTAGLVAARGQGPCIGPIQGDDLDRLRAYWPIRSLVTELLGPSATTPEAISRALGPDLATVAHHLAPILPIEVPVPPDAPPLPADAGPGIVAQMIAGAAIGLAAARRVPIFLEDLHWFDDASLGTIEALIAAGVTPVIAAARPTGPHLALVERLSTGDHVDVLDVTPLDEAGTGAVIAAELGAIACADDVVAAVHRRSGGNPLFARELTKTMVNAELIEVVDGTVATTGVVDLDAASFPETLTGVIATRIDDLDSDLAIMLKAAAIAGVTIDIDELSALCDTSPDETAAGVERLVDAGLFDRSDGRLRFAHALVRDAVHERIPFEQRCLLHHTLMAQEEETGQVDPARLAVHAEQAWLAGAALEQPPVTMDVLVAKAADHLEAAADQAVAAGMPATALDLGLRALAVLGIDLPRDAATIGAELGAEIGRIVADDDPEALRRLPPVDDPTVDRAGMLILRMQPAANIAQERELFALLALRNYRLVREHGLGAAAPGAIAVYASMEASFTGDARRAHARCRVANDLVQDPPSPLRSYVAFVRHYLVEHWVEPLGGRAEEILTASEHGFEVGDVLFGSFNLANHVIVSAAAGAPLTDVVALADQHHERVGDAVYSASFHLRHERQVARALAGATTDPCSLTDDRWDEARDIATVLDTPSANQIASYLASKQRLALLFGDIAAALDWGRRAAVFAESLAGQVHEAEYVFHHALTLYAAAGSDIAAHDELVAEAGRLVERIEQWATWNPATFGPRLELCRGVAAAVAGDVDVAVEHLDRAAHAAADAGHPHLEGLARERRAEILATIDPQRALDDARAAVAAYERWGATAKVVDVTDRLLAPAS